MSLHLLHTYASHREIDLVNTFMNSPISGFPNFKDGDVLVVLSPNRTYNLHATMLRHSSNFFAGLIREETGAKLSSKAKNSGVKTRFYIELTITRGNYGFSSKVSSIDDWEHFHYIEWYLISYR